MLGFLGVRVGQVGAAIENPCLSSEAKLRFETDGDLSSLDIGSDLEVKLLLDDITYCGGSGIEVLNMRIRYDKSALNLKTVNLKSDFEIFSNLLDDKGILVNSESGYVDIFAVVDLDNGASGVKIAGSSDPLALLTFSVIREGQTTISVDRYFGDMLLLGLDGLDAEVRYESELYWSLIGGLTDKVSISLPIGVCAHNLDFDNNGTVSVNDFSNFRLAMIDYLSTGAANFDLIKKLDFDCNTRATISDFSSFRLEFLEQL